MTGEGTGREPVERGDTTALPIELPATFGRMGLEPTTCPLEVEVTPSCAQAGLHARHSVLDFQQRHSGNRMSVESAAGIEPAITRFADGALDHSGIRTGRAVRDEGFEPPQQMRPGYGRPRLSHVGDPAWGD